MIMVIFFRRLIIFPRLLQKNVQPCHRFESTATTTATSFASTIFALSTSIKNTGSAIAVVRLSGPRTMDVVGRLTSERTVSRLLKNPRKATLASLYDTAQLQQQQQRRSLIDRGMLLWFPAPNSYTGDDMAEFHLHGSPAVIGKLLSELATFAGCRPATAGEFTKRALVNGKLDLLEAEGVRDLIGARTDAQRRRALSALSSSDSGLAAKFEAWRKTIIGAMAHLEAYIDFAEDELISEDVLAELVTTIAGLAGQIRRHIARTRQRSELIRDGLRVAIIGEANVGKSSLINRLCDKELSITSPVSGTTRDVLECWIDFAGHAVCLADTAGIKDLEEKEEKKEDIDSIEREGIRRAIERAKGSHIIVLVVDAQKYHHHLLQRGKNCNWSSSPAPVIPDYLLRLIQDRPEAELLLVGNKVDLLLQEEQQQQLFHATEILPSSEEISWVSCRSGHGLDDFTALLRRKIEAYVDREDAEGESEEQATLFFNERHLAHLQATTVHLEEVLKAVEGGGGGGDLAITASRLRQAAHQLACLTGRITTDDVLDVLFKDFCIGK